MEEQTLRLADLVRALRRRVRIVIGFTLGTLLAAILLAALLPNKYEAYTTMLIEPQSISSNLVDAGTTATDLMNRLHIMSMQILSRARLSRVIDDLGLYPELSREMTREEVIAYMRSQIWLEPVIPEIQTDPKNKTITVNTFRLFFRHESPSTVAAVANRLASDFIDEHIRERVQVSGDTVEFIEAELARLAQRIREVDAQIARVKQENAGSLPEDLAANQTLQTRTLDALRESSRRLAEAEADATFYRQQATVARTTDSTSRTMTPAMRMQELQMAMGELRSRGYTDRHPDIVTMKAELEELRQRISGGGEGGIPMPVSAAEQEALALAKRAELRAETERAEQERLRAVLADVEARLARTPLVAEQLDGLMREYQSLAASYQDFSNKRLEATVAANMERRQKGEQFRVLEPAFQPPDPVSPNRPLIMAVGLLLGLFLGVGTAIVLEATSDAFHEPRTMQDQLRIPVLASIPGILLKADLVARRRRLMREIIAAGAVSMLVLAVAGVGYVYTNMPSLWPGGQATAGAAPAAASPAARPAETGSGAAPAGTPAAPGGSANR